MILANDGFRNQSGRFMKNILSLIFISIIIYIIFSAVNIYSFSYVNQTTNADVAVVLGASTWNDRPSPVFQERINHGIWLYKNGYVKYIIFTGGIGKNSTVSEASVAKHYSIMNNVPSENIFIEEESKITFENILYAKNIISNHNFKNIIIVSDPMHMKRAITIAKDLKLNVYSSPTPTTRYLSSKTKAGFLFYELFFFVMYNFIKYSIIICTCLFLIEILLLVYFHISKIEFLN